MEMRLNTKEILIECAKNLRGTPAPCSRGKHKGNHERKIKEMQNTENKLQKQETAVQIPTGADYLRARLWYKPDKTMHYDDFVVTPTGYVAKLLGTHSKTNLSINQFDLQFNLDSVVMRCTGLKDKNGVLIYEGDILQIYENLKYPVIVRWNKTGAEFYMVGDGFFKNFVDIPQFDIKIIGNIYQTKELAEKIRKGNKDDESN